MGCSLERPRKGARVQTVEIVSGRKTHDTSGARLEARNSLGFGVDRMNEHEKADRDTGLAMSRKEFKQLGDGEVAYIKQLNIDLAQKLFPALRGKLEGIDLYAVLGADGTPLALTDSRNAAIANALENDLVPLSVH
jgi:hypothetical protein